MDFYDISTVAGVQAADMRTLESLRAGSVVVLGTVLDDGRTAVMLDFRFGAAVGFMLLPSNARRLAEVLRAHAALGHEGLPFQPAEEPTGGPGRAWHEGGGWVLCWTPWPPPDVPVVWLFANMAPTAQLTLAQAVEVADALDAAADDGRAGTSA